MRELLQKMKFFCEIQDCATDGGTYAKLIMGGTDHDGKFHEVKTLEFGKKSRKDAGCTYGGYSAIRESIQCISGITLPLRRQLKWTQEKGRKYAYVDATQSLPNGCVVSRAQILAGHQPDFN